MRRRSMYSMSSSFKNLSPLASTVSRSYPLLKCNFVVMKSSSRGIPERFIPSATSLWLPYASAVSICRYPSLSAVSTLSTQLSPFRFQVPNPMTGMCTASFRRIVFIHLSITKVLSRNSNSGTEPCPQFPLKAEENPHAVAIVGANEMKRDNLSFYERELQGGSVSIVSVPIELGSDERGLAKAPRYLLDKGLEKVITSLHFDVSETKMITCPRPTYTASAGSAKYLEEIAMTARDSCAAVEKAARHGDFVLALGGDHSMAIGTIAGAALAHRSLGVIWIDAHPDANTHETTLSGNIHGMPAAALLGAGHPLLTKVGGMSRKVAAENFLYIGIKDMDEAEIRFLRERSISAVTMLDIAEHGLSGAMRAIDTLRRKVDVLWVSMDMDSIDKEYAPGVGMPTDGGLTRREILSLAHYIGKTGRLAGMDIVEISPAKDEKGKTAALALELVARFLGGEHSWYENYMEDYRRTNVTGKVEEQFVNIHGKRKT